MIPHAEESASSNNWANGHENVEVCHQFERCQEENIDEKKETSCKLLVTEHTDRSL